MISGVKWMFRCRSGVASSIAPPYYDGSMSGSVLQELAGPLEAAVAAAGGDGGGGGGVGVGGARRAGGGGAGGGGGGGGEPVRLDRPADVAHGDYASAVAL